MIWSRLKNFKCPKCNKDLKERLGGRAVSCSNYPECDLMIGKERFDELVLEQYKSKRQRIKDDTESRQEELNNLQEI